MAKVCFASNLKNEDLKIFLEKKEEAAHNGRLLLFDDTSAGC